MKQYSFRSITRIFSALLLAGVLAACTVACNNRPSDGQSMSNTDGQSGTQGGNTTGTDSSTPSAMQATDNTMADAQSGNPDSFFVMDAIINNNNELKLLRQGLAKGSDATLKQHARHMIADHEKLGRQMKDYARRMNYPVRNNTLTTDSADMNELNSKTGKDWDKAWTDLMVEEHRRDIRAFEQAQGRVHDQNLSSTIGSALPVLRDHLEMVVQLQGNQK